MPTDCRTCFVIMPFSETNSEHTEEYWTKHFMNFLKPLIEENPALEARRSQPLRGDILREIITELVVATIVVADLTDRNANVFWELGVRQSFKHGTITIAEAESRLPFDLSSKGTLFYYPRDYIKSEEFRAQFKAALQDCLAHSEKPDSQVLEAINGRGSLFEIFRKDESIRRIDALISELIGHQSLLTSVRKQGDAKQEKVIERNLASPHLTPAIELLYTNRYLDEDVQLYNALHFYLHRVLAINSVIEGIALSSRTSTDLTSFMDPIAKEGAELREALMRIRSKLINTV